MSNSYTTPVYLHIFNRGVDKRPVFFNSRDKKRFIKQMRTFRIKDGVQLVEIHAFCILDNHYHIFLEELIEGGVSKFMQRLGTGYMHYVNKKYDRSGRLFQSGYKSESVETEGHLLHLSRYIHLNALQYIFPNWKRELVNVERAKNFLRNCKWSSLRYVFSADSDSWVDCRIIEDEFKDYSDYERFLEDWIRYGVPSSFSMRAES